MAASVPDFVEQARTWTEDVAWWEGRREVALRTAGVEWSGAELIERAVGASQRLAGFEGEGVLPALLDSIAPGGVLLYETFMIGNERFGKPSNPAFLLTDGELLEAVRGRFSVVAYEARLISEPHMAMVQRIAARRL